MQSSAQEAELRHRRSGPQFERHIAARWVRQRLASDLSSAALNVPALAWQANDPLSSGRNGNPWAQNGSELEVPQRLATNHAKPTPRLGIEIQTKQLVDSREKP